KTTPIIRDEIRPFARQILPTISALRPDTRDLAEAFPKLATSFAVLNEFFNELAANPKTGQPGFLFYLGCGNHNRNSVVSRADAVCWRIRRERLELCRSALPRWATWS